MKSWFGKIEIEKIENIPLSSSISISGTPLFNEMNIRFVHYPDCQQLIIWLPHPGREYKNLRLINKETGKLVEEWPVTDKLSGSIQLIWDTLVIAPGLYSIEIDWEKGWQHQITIIKYEEGYINDKKQTDTQTKEVTENKEEISKPIIYKDGFGHIIPDEDLILREKLNKDILRKFSRSIEYEGNFRAGTIIYIDGDIRIRLNHEMGGGNCMFYIDIPSSQQWEAETKTPLADRTEILEYIARTVQSQQASNCNFEIREDAIGFYYR
jgi:hypothetical protein